MEGIGVLGKTFPALNHVDAVAKFASITLPINANKVAMSSFPHLFKHAHRYSFWTS